jgi:serine/threonine protein kinase
MYAAEVLIAIESLHARNIIYRDLKPENVLIDEDGHCVLTDFGLSKEGVTEDQVNKSFCGSVAYLAPEVLKKQGHTQSVDWYNFGTLIYEMLESRPPYFADNRDQIYKNILKQNLTFSSSLSPEVKELLTGLLQRDPKKRLSVSEEIKAAKWFKKISWKDAEEKKLPVPKPPLPIIKNTPMAAPMELEDSPEDADAHNMVKWTYMRTDDKQPLENGPSNI